MGHSSLLNVLCGYNGTLSVEINGDFLTFNGFVQSIEPSRYGQSCSLTFVSTGAPTIIAEIETPKEKETEQCQKQTRQQSLQKKIQSLGKLPSQLDKLEKRKRSLKPSPLSKGTPRLYQLRQNMKRLSEKRLSQLGKTPTQLSKTSEKTSISDRLQNALKGGVVNSTPSFSLPLDSCDFSRMKQIVEEQIKEEYWLRDMVKPIGSGKYLF